MKDKVNAIPFIGEIIKEELTHIAVTRHVTP